MMVGILFEDETTHSEGIESENKWNKKILLLICDSIRNAIGFHINEWFFIIDIAWFFFVQISWFFIIVVGLSLWSFVSVTATPLIFIINQILILLLSFNYLIKINFIFCNWMFESFFNVCWVKYQSELIALK